MARILPLTVLARRCGPAAAATLALTLAIAGGLSGGAGAAPGAEDAAEDPCAQGRSLYREGRFADARDALLRCLETHGESVEVLLPLAVMGVREGRIPEAVGFGDRAVQLAPDDPEARYWYGRALLRADRVEDARAQWEAGLQLTFDHPGILEALARLALREGETAKAYNLLTQLQRQGVQDAWIHRLLADIAAGKGLWAQALEHLQAAMAQEGPQVEDLLSASELSILAGQNAQAVGYCRQAVAAEPGGRTQGALGEAFFAAEQLDSALVWLRLAASEPDVPPRVVFNLANALEVSGLHDEAGERFRDFLTLVPDDAVGHFNYGIHLESAGRVEEALAEVTRAAELEPTLVGAYVVKAQILENLERWDEALAVVALLRERDPGSQAELREWEQQLLDSRDGAAAAAAAGKVHLLHMVLGSSAQADQVQAELAAGRDFADLAVIYSQGPAAARGGDVGWIDPREMAEPMRAAVMALEQNEISPLLEARGLYHLFKRIR